MSNSGLATELLWNVKQVTLDGKPLKMSQSNRVFNQWDGHFDVPLLPGEHELKIDVDCAYVDENSVPKGNAWSIPPSGPKAKKRWMTTITVPLKVEAAVEK